MIIVAAKKNMRIMKKLNAIIPSAIIGVAIVILGFALKAGIDNIAFRDREVTVKGLAEREVKADLVTWPISYSIAGDDLSSLYDQVSRNNEKIITFLTSNGISREEISVNPPDTYNAMSNQYRSGTFNYNYSITSTVSVTTTKVDKVRELLNRQSELLKDGVAFSNSYINYQFTGLNKIKPEMIGEATKAARGSSPVCSRQRKPRGQDQERQSGTVLNRRCGFKHSLHEESEGSLNHCLLSRRLTS